jgi:hypothetical protein
MRSIKFHAEFLSECRKDVAAERLAAARVAKRTARAAYDAAKRADMLEPSDLSRHALLEAEHALLLTTRQEAALTKNTSEAKRFA